MRVFVVAQYWRDEVVFSVYTDFRAASDFCAAVREQLKNSKGFVDCDVTECELQQ